MLDSKIDLIEAENNISELIIHNIYDLIYDRNKSIDIYSLEDQYFTNEKFNVFMNVNENILSENIYLFIENINNNINEKIYSKNNIQGNFYEFNINPKYSGSNKISAKYINNDENIISSNIIDLDIIYQRKETEDIYLNQKYLMNISNYSEGHYAHHRKLTSLLKKIIVDKIEIEQSFKINFYTYKYFWLLIIFLLSVEWYLRNRIGLL